MKIQKNIGNVARAIRVIVGMVLLLFVPLVLVGPEFGWAWAGLVGVFPVTMGLIGYCPRHAFLRSNMRDGGSGCVKENDECSENACY